MKHLKLAILVGALTSIAAVAVAQNNNAPVPPKTPEATQASPNQPRRMGRLARLDTNNDGAIDQQEFATAQNLKDADANGDGTLSKEELVAMIQKRQAERRGGDLTELTLDPPAASSDEGGAWPPHRNWSRCRSR